MLTFMLIGATIGVLLDRKFPSFIDKCVAGLAWVYAKVRARFHV